MPPVPTAQRRRQSITAPGDMRENQLDEAIEELCKQLRIVLSYHTVDSRKSRRGFPDRVYVGRSGILFRELKAEDGRITSDQQRWADAINAAGGDAGFWRPVDLASGRIVAELAAIARRRRPAAAPPAYRCGCLIANVALYGHVCDESAHVES